MKEKIRSYWDSHIHDLAVAKHPVGTAGFFDDLTQYRFEKLDYLSNVVSFESYRGKKILEVGCGIGIDLARFAKHGAHVTGIDLSSKAIELARENFKVNQLAGTFKEMDGEQMSLPDNEFDVVYAHGVLQYTSDPHAMMREAKRILKPGGEIIIMVYNTYSWLKALRIATNVKLEHEDAPVIRTFSYFAVKDFLKEFKNVRLVFERFPVRSRLHEGGLKGLLFNSVFVRLFNSVPKPLVRPLGWHIMGFGTK